MPGIDGTRNGRPPTTPSAGDDPRRRAALEWRRGDIPRRAIPGAESSADTMPDASILVAAVLNGLTTGAIYALVALGLTLIYGVLHIINFAHGSLLMLAMYAVFFLNTRLGLDPYLALPIVVPAFFLLG